METIVLSLVVIKMERDNRSKKLPAEIKGALISMFQSGTSYSEIARVLGINVSKY